jgi:polyisoprenoid-binding protein YceI
MRALLVGLALCLAPLAAPRPSAAADTAAAAPSGRYGLDSHNARLIARAHVGVWRYSMRFNRLSGWVDCGAGDWRGAQVQISVDPASVSTSSGAPSRSLIGYFEPDKYPVIRFASTEVKPSGEGRGQLLGDLTLHGVTRPIVLDFVVHQVGDGGRLAFTGTGRIRRSEFRLASWPFTSDEVDLVFDVQFAREGLGPQPMVASRAAPAP